MRHSDDFGLIFSAKVLSLSYSSIPVPQAKACTPAIYLHGAEQIERDSQYPFFSMIRISQPFRADTLPERCDLRV